MQKRTMVLFRVEQTFEIRLKAVYSFLECIKKSIYLSNHLKFSECREYNLWQEKRKVIRDQSFDTANQRFSELAAAHNFFSDFISGN